MPKYMLTKLDQIWNKNTKKCFFQRTVRLVNEIPIIQQIFLFLIHYLRNNINLYLYIMYIMALINYPHTTDDLTFILVPPRNKSKKQYNKTEDDVFIVTYIQLGWMAGVA